MKDSEIFGSLYGDPAVVSILSDEGLVANMVLVEAALAKVQGEMGIIPQGAAGEIVKGLDGFQADFDHLRAGTEKAGFPVIALLAQLRDSLGGEAANYLHWGATTQDIMDTAAVLQIRSALAHMGEKLDRVVARLAALAEAHKDTLMAGRTHSQQAVPITFGLKVAGWLAPLLRHRERLQEIKGRVLALQFGGAAGTLAPLGDRGLQVGAKLGAELDLTQPEMPWHTQRDGVAELAGWLSLLTGSLAKIAQDVILLAQSEVGEVRESGDGAGGGSSTMPQKQNPIISEYVLAAARTNASLLSAIHQAQIQDHERAAHGWQLEMLNLPQMFILTSGALKNALHVLENLVVDTARMRENVRASNGLMLAEAVSFALAEFMSRAEAKKIVAESCRIAIERGEHLIDVVRERTGADVDWEALKDESNYLGSSGAFIDAVLERASVKR